MLMSLITIRMVPAMTKTKTCVVDGSGVPIRRQRAQKSEVPAKNQQRKETRDDGEQQSKVA
jgi:hypothetical protein